MFAPIHADLREESRHYIYLGSVAGADLWLDGDGDLRVVKQAGSFGWDYFTINKDNKIKRMSEDTHIDFKELSLIKHYLKTFVPDLYARAQALRAEHRVADVAYWQREDIDMM